MFLIDATEKMLAVILEMEKGRLFDVDDDDAVILTDKRRCI